jgi:hypothetical protein
MRRKIRKVLGVTGRPKYRTANEKFLSKAVPLSVLVTTIICFLVLAEAVQASGGLSLLPKPPGKAKLIKGKAIPPKNAPKRVVGVIEAANKIRKTPYLWGGGHGSFRSSGYDCSGAVSFALRGGRFVKSPMASGPMMTWGSKGRGNWITVYANEGHAYMVVAGLRFDTSNTGPGDGPRWSRSMVSIPGAYFTARHPKGH